MFPITSLCVISLRYALKQGQRQVHVNARIRKLSNVCQAVTALSERSVYRTINQQL